MRREILVLLHKRHCVNVSLFISRKLSQHKRKGFSRPVLRISIGSIAVSVAVMIISLAIVRGFQKEVREKIIGFGSHIQIRSFVLENNTEQPPIRTDRPDIQALSSLEGIERIFPYTEKAAMIKTSDQIHGIMMKGVTKSFDWSFFNKNLIRGSLPNLNADTAVSEVLISQSIASKMKLDVDSPMRTYFMIRGETQPRGRRFKVAGIYSTGMEDFDQFYVIGDMRHLQKINSWGDSLTGGYEISLTDFNKIDEMAQEVSQNIDYDLEAKSIKERQPQFFDWLELLDTNIIIIITLMLVVAIINVISIVLILILERIPMIGTLKTLGSSNRLVRRVFFYHGFQLLSKGIIWGNVAGIGICLLQYYFSIIPLPQEMYYVNSVPILIKPELVLLVNVGTIIFCLLAMYIPGFIIMRIQPSKAVRVN